MMTPLYIFSTFQATLKHFVPSRWHQYFQHKGHRYQKIWDRYGIWGIASLTPLILTPIGGSVLAFSFTKNHRRVFLPMWISALSWGQILSHALEAGIVFARTSLE